MDETYIHHNTPEIKAQSKQLTAHGESKPKKAKVGVSANKMMATNFQDAHGITHIAEKGQSNHWCIGRAVRPIRYEFEAKAATFGEKESALPPG